MNTKKWGPPGWDFLFVMAFNYPEKIEKGNKSHTILKKKFKELFEILKWTLPCKYCRKSYIKFLKELPIEKHLGSMESLTKWFHRIQNKVNGKLCCHR